jgi:integrase
MDDEATRLLRELLAKVTAQEDELRAIRAAGARSSSGKTLRELYEHDERGWAMATWAPQMRSTLSGALRHFGDKVADTLTRADWQDWRDNVRAKETTIRKGNPTPYTLNFEVKCWRSVLKRCKGDGLCSTNPLLDLRPIRGAKKHRETEPSEGDLTALLAQCSPRLKAFVLLSYRRGLRASEARRLEWKQVDLEAGYITLYAWQEKTRRTHRLKIPSDVVDALRAIKPDVGRYVFPGRSGPVVATTLWRDFRIAADKAGLVAAPGDKRVTYHDGRHALASQAARALPLPVAMRLMRHRSLNAAQRYIHVNERDLEAAHEMLEGNRKSARSADSVKKQGASGKIDVTPTDQKTSGHE